MKRFNLSVALCCLFLLKTFAQVQTPRYVSMTPNTNGYYEYLPQGYDFGNETFPLIIFVHGFGDLGNGSPSELPRVLNQGIPKLIDDGTFPTYFNSNGQTFRFIVISPQFEVWPTGNDIKGVVDFAEENYRVNINRIYITGLSMGGGVTWDYAGQSTSYALRIAAIVPVAGASDPQYNKARRIADADLAVWATHNDGDPTVPVSNTDTYVNYINQAPAPSPLAKKTIFNSDTHDAWSTTYDPAFKENGLNIYEWMLQYQRNFVVLPVRLILFQATETQNQTVKLTWDTQEEEQTGNFTLERSTNGVRFESLIVIPSQFTGNGHYEYSDENPLTGDNYYRLKFTGIDNNIMYSPIQMVSIDELSRSAYLYPNPAKDRISLVLNNSYAGPVLIDLIDFSGNVIEQTKLVKPAGQFSTDFSIQSLPKGNYILKVITGSTTQQYRFIRQ